MNGLLPGGPAVRTTPAGVRAGAPLTRIADVRGALGLVAAELQESELALRELVQSDVRAVPAVAGYLVDAGGKRLRPALTAIGARLVGMQRSPVRLMCVGELLHLGSLLHDDVVDDGHVRAIARPRTACTATRSPCSPATSASRAPCRSPPKRVGSRPSARSARWSPRWPRARCCSCSAPATCRARSSSTSTWSARKSAALIAWCVQAPALATGHDEVAAQLERYGRAVGVAFQITDDVLDYSDATGKSQGADLRERKVTLPLVHAMARLPQLRAELEAGPPADAALPALVERIRASGALDAALDDARARVKAAAQALAGLPESEARDALEVLAGHLVERVR
jgi:octaprenyl-diphosphate synthase